MRISAEQLFTEAYNALHQISEKIFVGSEDESMKATESSVLISELEQMLQNDKEEFEVGTLDAAKYQQQTVA